MESSSTTSRPDVGAVGVVVVGTGFIADLHLAALHAHPDAQLIGVVDVVPARAAAVARANGGVRCSTDLAEALAWPGVHAAVVCTPNMTHADIATRVAAAGKHLLIEKPLAVTAAQAAEVVDAHDRAGTTLMVAHTHRFYDYGRVVREQITAGAVGTPRLIRLAILGGWIWPDWRGWNLDPARSGGHALHNGVHLLDLVTWWIGQRPVSVYARGAKQTSAHLDIYDHLDMVVRYEDGAVAICEMSRGHRPQTLSYRDVLVQGGAGTLTVPWDGEASLVIDERGPANLPIPGGDGFARQMAAWIAAVRGDAPAPVSGADGMLAVALGAAAERSMATGRPVPVADILAEVTA
ncbi:Gfo/Idh/MocA family oxidoreductase [Micromonospora sp. NPDC050686]|uniref:Gfo/Idh/MocA family protein n=1 Tax=Micromonospora sp. NPDC050686 TaxID=3154631 RepID=UPI00340F1108